MYYYYYYNSFVQLNFRFLGEYPNTKSKDENISTNDIEDLINCINELNKCAIENSIGENKYDKNTHSLMLKKISYNSPLDLSIIVPLAASISGIPYLILKSIEKINDIRIKSLWCSFATSTYFLLKSKIERLQRNNFKQIHKMK